MLARLAFAWTMARIAFVEAWAEFPISQGIARRQLRRIVRDELHERRCGLRVIDGGRGLDGKGVA